MRSNLFQEKFSAGGLATLACLMEVSAPKPGNVHRGADFEDTTFYDFQWSAVTLGQTIDRQMDQSMGQLILECVRNNLASVGKNTNLGLILLLCPLAKSLNENQGVGLSSESVGETLTRLDEADCYDVYQAIQLAAPGGLGESQTMDVAQEPPRCLLSAMRAAENRDLVARQYSRNFANVFEDVIPLIRSANETNELHESIVIAQIRLMAKFPDSLIARKCGPVVARHAQLLAQKCVDRLGSRTQFVEAIGELDFWLRSDGNQRNPGTIADLIGAGLFVMLANGEIG